MNKTKMKISYKQCHKSQIVAINV